MFVELAGPGAEFDDRVASIGRKNKEKVDW